MNRRERVRCVVALAIGLVLHALLLLVPLSHPGHQDAGRSVEVELVRLPPPKPFPVRRVPPARPLEALPERPRPSEPPAHRVAGRSEGVAERRPPEPAPVPVAPQRKAPAISGVALMAEAFLEDEAGKHGVFGPAVPDDDPTPALAWRVPERRGLDDLLDRPLPDLPFEDPGLVAFMYAPGFTGEAHRFFDTITPEFGWTSKTGFKIRCRFVLVVVGCGWGR